MSDTGSDRLLATVRRQLSLGRLVPLGGPGDGAWLAERAAAPVLRRAAATVPGVAVTELRLAVAGEPAGEPAVPPPPSALPPGPLLIDARFAADDRIPLRECAERVRAALAAAAGERLGLDVVAIDLEVTDLLAGEPPRPEPADRAVRGTPPPSGPGAHVAEAVLAVPGVRALSGALGGPARAVEIAAEEPLIRLQLAVGAERRTLDIARAAARAAAGAAGSPPPRVAVLITDIHP
ncbi:nucleopolyhedrovirus P10 family protein [Streptomyces litchfieldiae]|uniref:Nucleopolyhedrovirus P10 family protein n=1 Tax=Streptomyces litchfieldiae TaxID=3075543 RepID=A0ABU2MTY2_9ACTN|nr:nucleopolyhedrovirus P10 family protein [Streptomyces sp. DSM 44938]MDT0344862.1 nucleopolyhedrovirus P10 family protein [Streptomyces sp. DSM 44938]